MGGFFAISSNRKNQSFFNYYGPRKLVTGEPAPDQPEQPTGGTGKITLKKTAGGTTTGLAGARFSIYFNGQIVGSDVTDGNGEIHIENAATGLWSFVETAAPDGYCVDPTPKSVYVDVTEGDREYTVAAVNYEKPDMKIIKRDAMSGKPIAGTVFSIKSVTGSYSTSVTTGTDGSATLSAIPAGVYVVREESVPEPYIVSNTEQTVALRPGKTSEVTFVDYVKPGLEILKKNIATGEPIEGVTYRIEQIDGSFSTSATTDNHGRIFLESIPVGSYKVTEINVPSHVILCPIPQEVALKPGKTSTVTFFNALKPSLEIRKVDSVTGDPIKGAKFQIWYGSNHTDTGELNDLGTCFSDASGKIILPEVKDGWYKVTELEPASGYAIKEPATQECFISGGESKVLTFENTPLSAIIIRKVDSESGQPLEGAWFRIRYLGGTSGTGGTVIGEYRTSSNGTIVVTGLKAGTYVCEEISAPDGYVITDAAETVYLSGKDQDVITVTFGNDKMGSLLIVKKDAVTGAPISDVEFLVTDSDGSVIGTANGKYVTDSAGTIRIDGLTPGMTVIAKEVRAKDGYIGNLVFQALKSMAVGLGFEGEDPKLLFTRTFVFAFLLMASPQICEVGLSLTARIIELLEIPDAIDVTLVDEGAFGSLNAAWLLVIIFGLIIMFKVFRLLLEIAERYVILAVLTMTAPLAFAMGGSKSTSEIFGGWCRMFGSMCTLMVTNVIFFKMLLSVLANVPSGLDIIPWIVLVLTIVKVARKADAIITRIGLNPAITGDSLGRGFPGTLTYMVMRSATSHITKTIGKSTGKGNRGAASGSTTGGPRIGGGPSGAHNAAGHTASYQAYQATQQQNTSQGADGQGFVSQRESVQSGGAQTATQEHFSNSSMPLPPLSSTPWAITSLRCGRHPAGRGGSIRPPPEWRYICSTTPIPCRQRP